MTYLAPADKLTHIVAGVCITLVALPLGWAWAAALCGVICVAREVYGRWRRARPMSRDDWREAVRDIVAGLAGGAAVLGAALIGLGS